MNELELRDIHLPDASLWWPPAPGWWVTLALLVLLAVMIPWLIRRLRQKPVNRLCLQELKTIRQRFAAGQRNNDVVRDTAALLRRTLIAYRGREGFAASTGDAWVNQLQALADDESFSQAQLELLGHRRYQRDSDSDIDNLLQACERWIRALPRREAYVSD
ncbi:MAG: DUF4381 domain-containing protein [Gammaproteobacteria bacterium]|nr:DUF4381 domain-containing protein [Gammaproteobacteria bacterium]